MSVVSIVGVSVTLFAWVISVISTALPYWSYQNQGNVIIHAGLWKFCIVYGDTSGCGKPSEDWIHAVQALMVIGTIVLFFSMLCGCLRLRDESRTKVTAVSTLAVVLGGFLVTAAVIEYGVKNRDNSSYFSAGFYLAIISAVTSFIAATLFAVSRRNSGYTSFAQ